MIQKFVFGYNKSVSAMMKENVKEHRTLYPLREIEDRA